MSDRIPEVHAVLLIPAEGDPHGLLRNGPCGARPPTANTYDWLIDPPWTWFATDSPDVPGAALVLAWDGKPVPEGLDRFYRNVLQIRHALDYDSPSRLAVMLRAENADPQTGGFGTLVLLDVDGKEITP